MLFACVCVNMCERVCVCTVIRYGDTHRVTSRIQLILTGP